MSEKSVAAWYVGRKVLVKDADVADFLARVRDGWMLQDAIRNRLEARGLLTRGKRRDWLTDEGRAFLEANPRGDSLEDVLDRPYLDVESLPY